MLPSGPQEASNPGNAPPLERAHQLDTCASAIGAAEEGHGSVVLLVGPPGIGKSTVLTSAAAMGGGWVLKATGRRLEAEFPFGLARQLFERIPSDDLGAAAVGAAAIAGRLLEGEQVDGGDAHATAVSHGLYWLMANLSARAPLTLVADDLHWADAASLRFLEFLGHRLDDLPVAVLAATRPHPEGDAGALIGALAAQPGTRRVALEALSQEATAQLVRRDLPDAATEFAAACAHSAGGNPFLARELVAQLVADEVEPSAEAAGLVGEITPESVQASLVARLAELPEEARPLARAVAVLNGDAELRRTAALTGLSLDAAASASARLVRAGILAEDSAPEPAHPLIVTAVLADMTEHERAVLHLRAAELLHAEGAPTERQASHLARSLRGGRAWAVEVLLAAARRAAAQGAPESAVGHLRRALEEPPPAELRGEVLLELGLAEATVGDDAAEARIEAAAGELAAGPQRARALEALGERLHTRGDHLGAAAALERALDEAGHEEPELTLELRARFAMSALWVPELQQRGRERIGEPLEPARAPRSNAEREALATVGWLLCLRGTERERAVELVRRAWDGGAMLEHGGPNGSPISAIAMTLSWADLPGETLEVMRPVIAEARRRGSVTAFATASYMRGGALMRQGRLVEAIDELERAVDAARYGWNLYLPAAYGYLIEAQVAVGALDRAASLVDEGSRREETWAGSGPHARFLYGRLLYRIATRDGAGALADGAACEEIATGLGTPNPGGLAWRSGAALAMLRCGDRERAGELAAEELALAREWGAGHPVGVAQRTLGLIEGGDAGIERLAEAVEVLDDSGARLDQARALRDLGAALRRSGRRADARDPLRQALEVASECGAEAIADVAEEELRAAGGRPRRRRSSGRDSLTPSELRVAGMAAEGMTNREIAEGLFVTMKAVQYHLGNTYRKLEIGGRADLGDALGA